MDEKETAEPVPTKFSKSKIFCCVYKCNSTPVKTPNLSFHYFPKKGQMKINYVNKFGTVELIDKRILWERVLRMGKKVTRSMRVCSLHFVKKDFTCVTKSDFSQVKVLKRTVIPSVNLPKSSIESNPSEVSVKNIKERQARFENRQKNDSKENENIEICNCLLDPKINNATGNEKKINDESAVTNTNLNEEIAAFEKLFADAEVQVTSGDLISSFFDHFLKTDQQLSTATGIECFQLFDSIVDAFSEAAPELKSTTRVLNIRDRILLTFVKLKQNVSYSFLSLLFPTVTIRNCSEIIYNTLDILEIVLKPMIHFSSQDEISRNIPLCFANYPNTTIILDCTEIGIQKPKNLCCQINCYSHYKGGYTIKFMTGVTPAGTLSYVSKVYGGRASDKAIFSQSFLVDHLPKGSSVMVDKGFLIDDLCIDNKLNLIRPSFLRKQSQFSVDSALKMQTLQAQGFTWRD
ncbi:uncharacterized protein LOC127283766 [Leptopilina boulardi]|uniref:uncharacterized protein LOC127283766 n=1 Tax=Leptopilina boulardi TaxID=63433 RepID=UPI0021F57D35|nr:uncharacterized protein LOC127283766 [Leptopilina boulardi]